jgi:hypothetical protein
MTEKNQFDLKINLLHQKISELQKEVEKTEIERRDNYKNFKSKAREQQLKLYSETVDELIGERYGDSYFVTALAKVPEECSNENGDHYTTLASLNLSKEQTIKLVYRLDSLLVAHQNEEAVESQPVSLFNFMKMFNLPPQKGVKAS